MSTPQGEPSEEELRAAWEEQMRNITVPDVLIQTAVTLVNIAGRKLGLAPDAEAERDLGQVRDAIDAVRVLLPLLEREGGPEALKPLRDALASLQLEYAKLAQAGTQATAAPPPSSSAAEPDKEQAGPAQSSGRLWVPGS